MSGFRFVLDIALFPMSIFSPIVILLLVFANAVLVFAIVASAWKRKKEQEKIEQKLRNQMDAQASREKQDPKP